MTEGMGWILVGLAAVLTVAMVAVLLQLRRTLKSAEQTLSTLASTARHLNETIEGITGTLTRVNGAVDRLEEAAERASSILESLRGIGDVVPRVRSSMGVITSLGSAALGAFLTSFGLRSRAKRDEDAPVAPEEEVKTR